MKLLIVDPQPDSREQLAELVRAEHHTVRTTSNMVEARKALEKDEFDVMFSALRIGQLSGLRVLSEARSLWPRMTVVMMAGEGSVEEAILALHEGALDYLRLPLRQDQVSHVLSLVADQIALKQRGAALQDPLEFARSLANHGGYEVLLISPVAPPGKPNGIVHAPLDPPVPERIEDLVQRFADTRERAAVVLAAVERILARYREERVVSMLDVLRRLLEGKGPLTIAYDPQKTTATGALAVRASISSGDVNATLESLASPVRRLVLRRLAEGPCTFTQAMEAAHFDDTSKIAFHLRKLRKSGLIEYDSKKRYRLSRRGQGAIQILDEMGSLDSRRTSGNKVLAWTSPASPSD
jgi:CheY-like chemotaxis protein/DNA-binding transcriptional ArsR family regulator